MSKTTTNPINITKSLISMPFKMTLNLRAAEVMSSTRTNSRIVGYDVKNLLIDVTIGKVDVLTWSLSWDGDYRAAAAAIVEELDLLDRDTTSLESTIEDMIFLAKSACPDCQVFPRND